MAQADSDSTTRRAFLRSQTSPGGTNAAIPADARAIPGIENSDRIFTAIEQHREALDRRNRIIEEICATEERHKVEEREAWHSYEKALIALLTTKPTTMAGVIAAMNYVASPESPGPGICETILDGARFSSDRDAANAAERFPALSAEALREISDTRK